MGISAILATILSAASYIIDNKDLLDAVLESDELSDEQKERIKTWRKDVDNKWEDLLPEDE